MGTGAAADRRNRPRAILALLSVGLAIVGVLSILAAIAALICGFAARHRAKHIAPHERGAGLATWGLVLGGVAFVWQLVFWTLVLNGVLDLDDVFGWPFR